MNAAVRRGYGQLLAQVLNDVGSYRSMKRMSLALLGTEGFLFIMHNTARFSPYKLLMLCVLWGMCQMWCGAFVRSAIKQNRPELSGLVPQLRQRLIRLTAALYAANTLVFAVIAHFAFGHGGYGLLAATLVTTVAILTQRFNMLAWGMALLIPFGVQFAFNTLKGLIDVLNEPLVTAAGMLLLLPLIGWGLFQLLPRGGDRHWAWYHHFSKCQAALHGNAPPSSAVQLPTRWQQLLRTFYGVALRRDSRAGTQPERMLMHVLGPAAHGGSNLIFLLAATVLALLPSAYAMIDGDDKIVLPWTGMILLGVAGMYVTSVADSITRHGAEQRLYLMTPGAPAGARINRLLGRTLLRRFLGVWLASVACVTCLDSFMLGHLALRGINFAIAMAFLWSAVSLLDNYAVKRPHAGGLNRSLLLMLIVLGFLVAMVLNRIQSTFPWYQAGCLLGIGAVIRVALAWRKLMALPPVLPAGRLAV
ncbi:hypothetical protein GJ698_00320 [Pseudoduganella sp. FT26W]|uniref:Uncharacterized protein n=1 Tax=Duganella aquatilis TaxID=2666082 RepID=A0A844CQM1_9BURK|nr:hypothetical protein [Duganella aquatilis]MRW82533.1 hypothetical protein [Duganella aquatilis]